ncbi:porin family protein [Chitinimonas sp. PSY-7]|uniref:outer membrane beta-barrel protein n=1 Tax=Chitinimonas sp. PSY-7 TaxID=3459088 RepID=UPI00403FDAF6
MKKIAVMIAAAVLVAPAFAEGIYAGLDMGRTSVKAANVSRKASNAQWFAGYQFNPNVAAEVGIRYLGSLQDNYAVMSSDVDMRAIQASALGIYPVNNEISIFGRVGVARLQAETTTRVYGGPYYFSKTDTETKTKSVLGLGARYAVTKQFGLRTEYNQYGKVDGIKVSTFSVAGDYHF